jgi:hypothetical protein
MAARKAFSSAAAASARSAALGLGGAFPLCPNAGGWSAEAGTGDRVGALPNKRENKDIVDLRITGSCVFYMRWQARKV